MLAALPCLGKIAYCGLPPASASWFHVEVHETGQGEGRKANNPTPEHTPRTTARIVGAAANPRALTAGRWGARR